MRMLIPAIPGEVAVSTTRPAAGERIAVVAAHNTRVLPLADRLVRGSVPCERGTRRDLIYIVAEGEPEIVRECADGPATARARSGAVVTGHNVQAFHAEDIGADQQNARDDHQSRPAWQPQRTRGRVRVAQAVARSPSLLR